MLLSLYQVSQKVLPFKELPHSPSYRNNSNDDVNNDSNDNKISISIRSYTIIWRRYLIIIEVSNDIVHCFLSFVTKTTSDRCPMELILQSSVIFRYLIQSQVAALKELKVKVKLRFAAPIAGIAEIEQT